MESKVRTLGASLVSWRRISKIPCYSWTGRLHVAVVARCIALALLPSNDIGPIQPQISAPAAFKPDEIQCSNADQGPNKPKRQKGKKKTRRPRPRASAKVYRNINTKQRIHIHPPHFRSPPYFPNHLLSPPPYHLSIPQIHRHHADGA